MRPPAASSRRDFLARSAAAIAATGAIPARADAEPADASARVEVGAYYFPNYHVDPRNEAVHGPGWTEWELVRRAEPRFPGHVQPNVPLWGYEDEADPKVMARKIDAAADHGLNHWIFDWYWYDDGPFLQRALEEGFLKAPNAHRLKFCCMWANHDWLDIMPAKRKIKPTRLYPGAVTRATFETLTRHVIDRYFQHPAHWTIEGKPYFSIYDLGLLVASFGGARETRTALDGFRAATRAAGLPGLHLNAVAWGQPILPGETTPRDLPGLVRDLGFDSVTSYVWIHHVPLPTQQTDFDAVQAAYLAHWDRAERDYDIPYYPNVSMGWDPSPRTVASDRFDNSGYPFTNTIAGNTPGRFRQALATAKSRMDADPKRPRILHLNAWNEWTEGSYLEPDTRNRLGYLEAIRDVFGAGR